MSNKNWWLKFEYRLWQSDAALSQCSLAARGFWLELICSMHSQDTDTVSGTFEQIARSVRCDSSEVAKYSLELKNANVADVTLGNGNVTLTSRKIKRELSSREQTRLRVQRHRSNENVTAHSKSKSKSKSKKEEERGVSASTPRTKQTQEEWVTELATDPVYSHVNIPHELGKAQKWIDAHIGRRLTKQFFLKWINRIDPPLNGFHSNGNSAPKLLVGCDVCLNHPDHSIIANKGGGYILDRVSRQMKKCQCHPEYGSA